jgi:hypothetical protein
MVTQLTIDEIKKDIADFRVFAQKYLKIKDKKGNIVPLIINAAQEIVLQTIEEMILAGVPIRIIVLKARQKGISTLIEAYIFWRTTYKKNRKAAVIGHKLDATNNLWDMTNRYYDNLPGYLQPQKEHHNAKELTYAKTKSEIVFFTAETGDVGSSQTIQDLHITELSKWRDAKTSLASLLQTVPDEPNTLVVMESTAKGFGGEFYDRCQMAKNGESNYRFIFLSWLIDDEYTLPFDSEDKKRHLENTLDEIEKNLILLGATLEHLNWRRVIGLPDKCGNDPDIFKQEYPSTPEEAFITSGRPVFDNTICNKNYVNSKPPIKIGDLEWVYGDKGEEIDVMFIDNPRGYIKIYEKLDVLDNEYYRFAAGCLPDDEKILTANGEEKIQDISPTSKLLDANGDYVDIINKQRRLYEGDLIEIKPFLTSSGTKFTAEHPILVLNDNKIHSHSNTKGHTHANKRYRFYNKEVIYKPAGQITEKDILRFPLPKYKRLTENQLKKYYTYSAGSGNIVHNPNSILKKEFWFMVGLWLAEGYTYKNNRGHKVCYCLSTHEKELREQIVINAKSMFNRNASQRVRNNSCEIIFSNKDFQSFLIDNFGKYANKKTLPNWVKQLPKDLVTELFRGYFNGDGCLIKEKNNRERINCVSVSNKLLNDFQDILLSLGIISSVKILRQEKQSTIHGRSIRQKETYELNISSRDTDLYWGLIGAGITNRYAREKHKGYAWIDGDFIYLKIHKLRKTNFVGYVNNFETKTHSYCARFIATHNCDVAEGLAQGDYSVIKVLDRKTNKVCLTWHGHIDPDLLADEQAKLQMFLKNKWVLNTERNNHGLSTIISAYKKGVNQKYNQNFTKGYEVKGNAELGFKTNTETKRIAINNLAEYIREGSFIDNEKEFWSEAMTFVRNDKGQMQAQNKDRDPGTKCFDDRVMAMALAIDCSLWMPNYYLDGEERLPDWFYEEFGEENAYDERKITAMGA